MSEIRITGSVVENGIHYYTVKNRVRPGSFRFQPSRLYVPKELRGDAEEDLVSGNINLENVAISGLARVYTEALYSEPYFPKYDEESAVGHSRHTVLGYIADVRALGKGLNDGVRDDAALEAVLIGLRRGTLDEDKAAGMTYPRFMPNYCTDPDRYSRAVHAIESAGGRYVEGMH